MKPALVLSGGGSRGAFIVGALEVLYESDLDFDIIAGTSTGALIASLLPTKEIQVLRGIYSSVTTDDIIRQRNVVEILATDSIYDQYLRHLDRIVCLVNPPQLSDLGNRLINKIRLRHVRK